MNTKLYCCEKCQLWCTCETKWYRGEKGEEQICCSSCAYYKNCLKETRKSRKSSK